MHQIELKWIFHLQKALRSKWTDLFFIGWNYVDTAIFALIVISVVWVLITRRIGIQLFYILMLSGTVNKFLKGFFGLPRPCQVDPLLGVLCTPSPGFPSGAAQTAILIAGVIWIESSRTLYRGLGVLFAAFLCFSRIYLGVHFFSDILGGLAVGGLLLLVYWKLFPLFQRGWKKWIFLFPILLLIIGQAKVLPYVFLSLGVAIGLLLAEKRRKFVKRNQWTSYWELACVLLGIIALFIGAEIYPTWSLLFALAIGLWLSYGGFWFMQRVKKQST